MSPKKSPISRLVEGLSPDQRREVLDLAAELAMGGINRTSAEMRIRAIRDSALRAARIAADEPANGRIVKFGHRFHVGGRVYTYAAIRADNPRGAHRWFVTGADYLPEGRGHRGLVSPATWPELVEFAIPHTILVAPLNAHWQPVSNHPAPQTSPKWKRQYADVLPSYDLDPDFGPDF